ncbi:MAG: acyl-CoA dehydratase activase [Syntrophales bacterium]|nr:acyl-CoA dehydratase activase [Syntrophales bacterium]
MPFGGIDIGSTMTKAVIIDDNGRPLGSLVGPTGVEHRHLAYRVMEEAARKAGIGREEISFIVATGYGRLNCPFADRQVTEITCHARGVKEEFPDVRLIIDIGGQDSKGIKLDEAGKIVDFVMNDKCAAGTGRFLEIIADTLGIPLAKMGEISLQAREVVKISNTCTVFAEHEVISRLAEGAGVAEICAGLHEAIGGRIAAMVRHLKVEGTAVVTGGGAKNIGLVNVLSRKLDCNVQVPKNPFLTGAYGAALLAKALYERGERGRVERRWEEVTFFQ